MGRSLPAVVLLLLLVIAEAGCVARESLSPAAPNAPFQVGVASYYHDSLAGNLTANGERYDPRALTAAHRRLPLGTVVDVVRRDGRAVRVRINDRGPYVAGRIIDLSRYAATMLGMLRAGIVEVAVYVVSLPPRRRGWGPALPKNGAAPRIESCRDRAD